MIYLNANDLCGSQRIYRNNFLSFLFSQRFPLLENKEELHSKQYIVQVQNYCHGRASYVELTFKSSRPNRNIQHIMFLLWNPNDTLLWHL